MGFPAANFPVFSLLLHSVLDLTVRHGIDRQTDRQITVNIA